MKKTHHHPAGSAAPPPAYLDINRLAEERNTRHVGLNIWAFERLPSTNSLLKHVPAGLCPSGLLCISRHQYQGRGQGQKRWESRNSGALTFSLYLVPPPALADRFQLLLQAVALSVLSSLKELYAINAQLKWPNDVLVGGQKICGVLAESSFIGSRPERLIMGMGINTNGPLPDEVASGSINIEGILGQPARHTDLLINVLKHLDMNYQRWLDTDSRLVTDINVHHRGYGRWVKLSEGKGEPVKFLGVDLSGHPVFLDKQDDIKRFTNTDIRFEPVD